MQNIAVWDSSSMRQHVNLEYTQRKVRLYKYDCFTDKEL